MKAKLYRVLDLASDTTEQVAPSPAEAEDIQEDNLDLSNLAKSEPAAPVAETNVSTADDDDDDLSIFKELARG